MVQSDSVVVMPTMKQTYRIGLKHFKLTLTVLLLSTYKLTDEHFLVLLRVDLIMVFTALTSSISRRATLATIQYSSNINCLVELTS